MKRHVTRSSPAAFTLIELMVAVALLSLVIVGVSLAFKSTITAVNTANAATDTFAGVQTVERQLSADLHGLDKSGFLVIRQRLVATLGYNAATSYHQGDHVLDAGTQYIALRDVPAGLGAPSAVGSPYWQVSYDYADQLVFMAHGRFPNMSGAMTGGVAPFSITFADRTVADAGVVWYGHVLPVNVGEGTYTAASDPMTGIDPAVPANETQMILGRHVFLMLPNDTTLRHHLVGTSPNYLTSPYFCVDPAAQALGTGTWNYTYDICPAGTFNVRAYDPRFTAVFSTPSEFMQSMAATLGAAPFSGRSTAQGQSFEATYLCYRFRTLQQPQLDPIDLAHGAVRTSPTMLPGTASFHVEWSYGPPNLLPTTHPAYNAGSATPVWYGYDATTGTTTAAGGIIEPPIATTGDLYTAQFSFDSQPLWPKALRITYRVVDPGNYLQGGRTVVQVINLP